MDGATLAELVMTVFLVLLTAAPALMVRAAGTGKLKRTARGGIHTAALTHCDDCWLLGHHAAAHKSIMGCSLAAVLLVASGAASMLGVLPGFVHPVAWMAGVAAMLGGLLLGLRDAHRAVAKIHAGARIVSA